MTTRKIVLPTCDRCPHRDHAGAFGNPAHKPVCRLGKRDLPYNEVAHNGRAHAQATEVIPDWCPLGVDQSTQSLITALEKIAAFKPKSAADGVDGWEEWNRAGRYVAKIARDALNTVRTPT